MSIPATLRDCHDHVVADIAVTPTESDISIQVVVQEHTWHDMLSPINQATLELLLNKTLYITPSDADHRMPLHQYVSTLTHGELHLVYDADQVAQTLQILKEIWQCQPHTVLIQELIAKNG